MTNQLHRLTLAFSESIRNDTSHRFWVFSVRKWDRGNDVGKYPIAVTGRL